MGQDFETSDSLSRRRAHREAAVWLARLDLGTADPAAFEAWRDRHVDHEVAFARVVGASEAASADPEAVALPSGLSRRRLLRSGAGAAVVALCGGAGIATRAYAWSSAKSGVGECRIVALPDGSSARLNTDSRLAWRFRGAQRTLWIERGEVALDLLPGAPCDLRGSSEPVALSPGRYNARLRGRTLDLLVMRGAAVVSPGPGSGVSLVRVAAGQGLLMPVGTPLVRATTADEMAQAMAWQQGEILFQHETLGSAVDEYNRYLPHKIVIVDRDLANIPVGGRFTSNDPSAFLKALNLGLGVQISSSGSGYLLTH